MENVSHYWARRNLNNNSVLERGKEIFLDKRPFLLTHSGRNGNFWTENTLPEGDYLSPNVFHETFEEGFLYPNKNVNSKGSFYEKVKSTLPTVIKHHLNTSKHLYSLGDSNNLNLVTKNEVTTEAIHFPTSANLVNSTTLSETILPSFSQCQELDVSPERISLCILLLLFALATIFGNSLVIIAIFRERYLHTVTNYFIMSLAVADCLVGTLVMPFSALYDSFKCWFFGPDFCDVWHSFDVLASTASILNLCVISMDRYWAITDPLSYPSRMSPKRAYIFIGLVWVCSALISFPAIAWWRARSEPHPEFACIFTEDLPYLFFSSTISFYGPLIVMVFTYLQIYRAATKQTRSLRLGRKLVHSSMGNGDMELRIHRGGGGGGGGSTSSSGTAAEHVRTQSQRKKACSCVRQNGHSRTSEHSFNSVVSATESDHSPLEVGLHPGGSPTNNRMTSRNIKNFSISRKLYKFTKEKKAAKTLGIVMGVFIVCWLPFFVNNLRMGLCGELCSTKVAITVSHFVTWLGWTNSAMNPVIYACMARDFRR